MRSLQGGVAETRRLGWPRATVAAGFGDPARQLTASARARTSRKGGGDAAVMPNNLLIPLPNFLLPRDFPWRAGFIALVDDQLRRLRATGHFVPPRFFGYFFQAEVPMGVGGNWTVSLDARPPVTQLPELITQLTNGHFSIVSARRETVPDYLLVHDRHDGACWLWSFADGLRFIEANEPVLGGAALDGLEKPKSLGP